MLRIRILAVPHEFVVDTWSVGVSQLHPPKPMQVVGPILRVELDVVRRFLFALQEQQPEHVDELEYLLVTEVAYAP